MRTLKRSAIILTISIAGLLAIRAADKQAVTFSGQRFTLEELAWRSGLEEAAADLPSESRIVDSAQRRPGGPVSMVMRLADASKCEYQH